MNLRFKTNLLWVCAICISFVDCSKHSYEQVHEQWRQTTARKNVFLSELSSAIRTPAQKQEALEITKESEAIAQSYLDDMRITASPKREAEIQERSIRKMESQISRIQAALERWRQK
jgi:hypothetical protein